MIWGLVNLYKGFVGTYHFSGVRRCFHQDNKSSIYVEEIKAMSTIEQQQQEENFGKLTVQQSNVTGPILFVQVGREDVV
jgi:hypothetical protein